VTLCVCGRKECFSGIAFQGKCARRGAFGESLGLFLIESARGVVGAADDEVRRSSREVQGAERGRWR
jgi:hypothetical protein